MKNIEELNNQYEFHRKFREYEMKIVKMAGHLADYYIDRALESDDFSYVSSFLIDYFSGPAGKPIDVYYLVSKYNEFGLNQKIEDIDFDIDEWYKIRYTIENKPVVNSDFDITREMSEEDYIKYMIEQRKKTKLK